MGEVGKFVADDQPNQIFGQKHDVARQLYGAAGGAVAELAHATANDKLGGREVKLARQLPSQRKHARFKLAFHGGADVS